MDPAKTDNPVWQIMDVGSGTYYLNVTSGDPDFHLGTNYYLSLQQTISGTYTSAVQVIQNKQVNILPNGIESKFMFENTYEQVLFFSI